MSAPRIPLHIRPQLRTSLGRGAQLEFQVPVTITGALVPSFGDGVGAASGDATASGDTTALGDLVGSASGDATASGNLTALGDLVGSASGDSTASGVLDSISWIAHNYVREQGAKSYLGNIPTIQIGCPLTITSITGAAFGDGAGAASGDATASGDLAAFGDLVGSASGDATASGDFAALGDLIGSASGDATASGDITALGDLVGSASGDATASGSLTALGDLIGSASGDATADAIDGTAATTSVIAQNYSSEWAFRRYNSPLIEVGCPVAILAIPTTGFVDGTGSASGDATASGDLTALGDLTGSASGDATASGVIEDATPAVVAPPVVVSISSGVGAPAWRDHHRKRKPKKKTLLEELDEKLVELRGLIEPEEQNVQDEFYPELLRAEAFSNSALHGNYALEDARFHLALVREAINRIDEDEILLLLAA